MKIPISAAAAALGIAAITSGCMIAPAVKTDANATLDSARLQRVKRVALMPFLNANGLSSDDPDPSFKGKFASMAPAAIVYQALKGNSRFELADMATVIAALKKRGFVGIKLAPGEDISVMKAIFHPDQYRTGFTMKQARGAGRDVGADALLFGAFGVVGTGGNNMRYVMAMRLVSPKNGKVLWGAAKAEPMDTSFGAAFHPMDTYKAQISKLARDLIAEVP